MENKTIFGPNKLFLKKKGHEKPLGMRMHTRIYARMLKVCVHMLHACCQCLASIGSGKPPPLCLRSTTGHGNSSRTHRAPLKGPSRMYGVVDVHTKLRVLSLSLSRWRKVDLSLALWKESGPNFKGLPKVIGVATNHWVFLRCDWSSVSS